MKTNKPILVLTGPTGSGKTSISLEIAKKYGNIEIICADSTTVYQGMDIGTDKPSICDDKSLISNFEFRISNSKNPVIPAKAGIQKTNAERLDSSLRWNDEGVMINGIPHHLLDIVKPDEEFNVSIFLTLVSELVEQIHSRGNIPMLVGGAVMYIDAFVFNYSLPPVAPDEKLRAELEKLETPELFDKLCRLDPDAESTVDGNNRRRIIRAIEVWMATERPLSEQKSKTLLPGNILYLAVDKDREELYANIDKRVDQMFRGGFIEEVKKMLTKYRGSTAMNSAGYKQITDFLDGNSTMEETAVTVKQAHRNYAKRQMTWLRKNPDVVWIKSSQEALSRIDAFLGTGAKA